MISLIENSKIQFSTVAMRGVSGALVGSPIAMMMDKYSLMVRKQTEDSHSSHRCEGPKSGFTYIIVDDFISGGSTCRSIIEAVGGRGKCVGIFLYWDSDSCDADGKCNPFYYRKWNLANWEEPPTFEDIFIPRYTIGRDWANEYDKD